MDFKSDEPALRRLMLTGLDGDEASHKARLHWPLRWAWRLRVRAFSCDGDSFWLSALARRAIESGRDAAEIPNAYAVHQH
jgi:hypothetical protein